jgi:phage tail-like protein
MDANGLSFWMLADVHRRLPDGTVVQSAGAPVFADWQPEMQPSHLEVDDERRVLRLASERGGPKTTPPADARTVAEELLQLVPSCRDAYGTYAVWRADKGRVMAGGAVDGEVSIGIPAAPPTDLAMGFDDVLYSAAGGAVVLVDRRDRWKPVAVTLDGFTARFLAADLAGGVWALDTEHKQLARLAGAPFRDRSYAPHRADRFRPEEENPDPPRLRLLSEVSWPTEERPVALACLGRDELVVLGWTADDVACVRRFDPAAGALGPAIQLEGAVFPYSIAWVAPGKIAVLSLGLEGDAPASTPGIEKEALVYRLPDTEASAVPVGDLYPLRDAVAGQFVRGVTLPPHYPTAAGSAPLYPVSLPSFGTETALRTPNPIDSGDSGTVWHRLYLEAVLPAATGVQVFVAATDQREAPTDAADWYEHRFGQGADGDGRGVIPRAAWVPFPSEIPFHEGFLDCPIDRNRAGLFTVLVQRAGRRVRTLRGRFLWVRMVLTGDGRATPEVAALRVYASRFSYLENYLPELYREQVFGPDADELAPGPRFRTSTPADFLERFIDNIEGVLTPIEDRIAQAYLLTHPRSAPDDALEWLASWIGLTFDARYPYESRRRLLLAAPKIYRRRGTLEGLRMAIDAVANDGVSSGEVVVVEDFRLRRTFATILGADLANEADPLLAGLTVSGNSYVGDTLFLGADFQHELLALFGASQLSTLEQAEVRRFYDRLADRLTILVHNEVVERDIGLINRVVELETPAHVSARVVTTSYPLLIGVAALIGVDTYLSAPRTNGTVQLNRSTLGVGDFVRRIGSLDPRVAGGVA